MIAIDVADLVVIAGELYGTGPDAALDRIDLDAAPGRRLPASACDRKRSIRVSAVMITVVRGWLSLPPVP